MPNACEYLRRAEMLKQLGDRNAESFYLKAIDADPVDPAYELFLADYLRNFRGPQRPLFPASEDHYLLAAARLNALGPDQRVGWDDETRSRVWRGLAALHERDGIALVPRPCRECKTPFGWGSPLLALASINRETMGGAALDEQSDARDYTTEALTSQVRLYNSVAVPLPNAVLAAMIRSKPTYETLDRLRFRFGEAPAIDFFYDQRYTKDAQITRFDRPNEFNDFHLRSFGFAAEKPFTMGRALDAYVSFSAIRSERRGLIEFQPLKLERVWDYNARAAISRFNGPDKLTLEAFFDRQNVSADQLRNRPRTLSGATFTYQLFRPVHWLDRTLSIYQERFETRGINFFVGYLNDGELFLDRLPAKDLLLRRKDKFAGVAIRGIGRFDLTIQPTLLSAWAGVDPRLNNSQYRTNITSLVRLKDEEREPGLPGGKEGFHLAFVHLVFPFRHDLACTGPSVFENYVLGSQLDTKFYQTAMGTASYFASVRYERQNYYNLGKTLNVITVSVSLGF
jgi:hypothetical protein